MSDRLVYIADLNPVQFYEQGKQLPARYHKKHLGDGWSYEDALSYENKAYFAQKVQFDQLISVQVRSNLGPVNNNDIYIDILDCDGNVKVAAIAYVQYEQLPGDVVGSEQMTTWQFKFKFNSYPSEIPAVEDTYRLRLTLEYNDGVNPAEYAIFLSEDLHLKTSHPGTLLVEYGNSENNADTVFEQISPLFAIRVEADIHSTEPASTTTAYTDMGERLVQLSSTSYEVQKLTVKNAPDYLVVKLNEIFSCDQVRIDGRLYVKDDGAKWELQTSPDHPLKGATIQLRPSENSHSTGVVVASFPVWLQGNDTYPKYIFNAGLYDGVNQVVLKEKVIEDATAGATYATALNNAATALKNGTAGTWAYTNHALVYTNATGENWSAITDPAIITDKLTFTITINTSNGILGWKDGLFVYGIDWGDNSVENKVFTSFTSINTIVQHEYASTGNYTVRIFHGGDIASSYFNYPSDSAHITECTITNIAGTLPGQTYRFYINGSNGAAADLSGMSASGFNFLRSAIALSEIILHNCKITVDIGQIFNGISAPNNFAALRGITLTNNQLTAAEAASVINEFMNNCSPNVQIYQGIIRLKQNPAAVIVDATALSNITALTQALGWTVLHD